MSDKIVEWLDLEEMGYDDAFGIQETLHEECWRGLRRDIVLFQRNEPIITCGIDAEPGHILWGARRLSAAGIKVKSVSRGGGVSYHGPGQVVISPVMHFMSYRRTALLYLRALEEVTMRFLAEYGLEARRVDGKSGVFVGDEKIAAVGLALSHSVTMHGISLNICPDMSHYDAIIACGLHDMGVTSLEKLGFRPSFDEARDSWLSSFAEVFGVELKRTDLPSNYMKTLELRAKPGEKTQSP
jgi:lipoate-protein ligase B